MINIVGTNELIKKGGILVTNTKEIFKELNIEEKELGEKHSRVHVKDIRRDTIRVGPLNNSNPVIQKINISSKYKKVYKALSTTPKHINQIYKELYNINIKEINSSLIMLEIDGYIEQLPGQMFKIKG